MLPLTFYCIFQMKPNTYKTLENPSTIFHYKNKIQLVSILSSSPSMVPHTFSTRKLSHTKLKTRINQNDSQSFFHFY